jgi:hypothetical protein
VSAEFVTTGRTAGDLIDRLSQGHPGEPARGRTSKLVAAGIGFLDVDASGLHNRRLHIQLERGPYELVLRIRIGEHVNPPVVHTPAPPATAEETHRGEQAERARLEQERTVGALIDARMDRIFGIEEERNDE